VPDDGSEIVIGEAQGPARLVANGSVQARIAELVGAAAEKAALDMGAPRCRPHLALLYCLPVGRWFDEQAATWRDRRGRPARWPDLMEATRRPEPLFT
jgi:hypothetical protein